MKKTIILIITLVLILSLTGCIKTSDIENNQSSNIQDNQNHIVDQPTDNEENIDEELDNKDENEEIKQEDSKEDNNKSEDKKEEDKKEETKEEVKHTVDETKEISFPVSSLGKTYTGLKSLNEIKYVLKDPYNVSGLSEKKYSFSFGAAKEGKPHQITVDNQKRFDGYKTNALAWDNKTNDKVLYLTFDCGYEYKNLTSLMLDTLKEKDVSAAFFVTQEYLEEAPEVVARMIKEDHIVGNHSVNHPSNCAALSREEMAKELLGVHNYLRVNFGYNSQYFRFPTGAYSQNAIDVVNGVGYRSIFWSIAHSDWDPENQPGVDVSFNTVTSRLHPGAVILLHTTSPDNAEILGDFIDYARNEGYEFRTLDEYNYWK